MNYRFFSLFAFVLFTSFSNIPSSNNTLLKVSAVKTEKPLSMVETVYQTMDSREFSMPSFEACCRTLSEVG